MKSWHDVHLTIVIANQNSMATIKNIYPIKLIISLLRTSLLLTTGGKDNFFVKITFDFSLTQRLDRTLRHKHSIHYTISSIRTCAESLLFIKLHDMADLMVEAVFSRACPLSSSGIVFFFEKVFFFCYKCYKFNFYLSNFIRYTSLLKCVTDSAVFVFLVF